MLNNYIKNIKNKFTKKTEGSNKKNIENLVVFLILMIITIIAINVIWGNEKTPVKQEENNTEYRKLADNINNTTNSNNIENSEYNLEKNLEDILSKISGVGKIQVLITYSETSQVVAMYNEKSTTSNTEEADTNGRNKKD